MGIAGIRRTNYDTTWNGNSPGIVDAVDPQLKLLLEPITAGTYGNVVLGRRIIALEGQVLVDYRECSLTQIQRFMPWYTSGSIPLTPTTLNKDMYDYAQLLTLHPRDAADTNQDTSLLKAVPVNAYSIKRDGKSDDIWRVAYDFYPLRSALEATPSVLLYGYVGPVPPPPPP